MSRAQDRAIDYYFRFLEKHQDDWHALEAEYEQIQRTLESMKIKGLETAFNQGMREQFVRGVNLLSSYWDASGWYKLAQNYLTQAHQIAEPEAEHAKILCNLGRMASKVGDYDKAEDY